MAQPITYDPSASQRVPAVETITTFIDHNPGAHLRAIARGTGLGPSHVEYHVRRLVKEGRVTELHDGAFRRFFAKPTQGQPVDRRDRRLVAALRRRTALAILFTLLEEGPLAPTAIGQRIQRAPSTIHYHTKRLVAAGALQRHDTDGVLYAIAAPAAIIALLRRHPPRPDLADMMTTFWDGWRGPPP